MVWTLITSPLSLQRDSFITLDLKKFFSVLTLNFAFFPWKLMVSHIQVFRGFRHSSFVRFWHHLCSWWYKVKGFTDHVICPVMAQIVTQHGHHQLMAIHLSAKHYCSSVLLHHFVCCIVVTLYIAMWTSACGSSYL